MTVDFAELYSQLGIRTDCSLEEFKHACRRRIRQQHPDRADAAGAGGMDELDGATRIPLPELLPLYAKALRFHRKHGRLPGAAPVHTPAAPPRERGFPAAAAAIASTSASSSAVPSAGMSRVSARGPLLLMLAIAVVLIGITAWNDEAPTLAQPLRKVIIAAPETDSAPTPRQLKIGMDEKTVRSIQGEPVQQEGAQWFYGPSWLTFKNDRLADWYSSPLYRLKTPTESPAVDADNGEGEQVLVTE